MTLADRKKILAACLVLAFFFPGQVVFADLKFLCIPLVKDAELLPVIDGLIKKGEWEVATQINGLVALDTESFSQRQVKLYFISDGEWLYAGMQSPAIPAKTLPQVVPGLAYQSYTDFAANDRIELKIVPPDEHVRGAFYLIADAAGHLLDEKIHDGQHQSFAGEWDYRTTSDENGWQMELRTRLAQFGHFRVKNGAIWKINFSRVWVFPLQYTGLIRRPHDTASACFLEQAPGFSIQIDPEITRGKLSLVITGKEYEEKSAFPRETPDDILPRQTGGKPRGQIIQLLLEIRDENKSVLFSTEKSMSLKPDTLVRIEIQEQFPLDKAACLSLQLVEKPKNRLLYQAEIPVKPFNPGEVEEWGKRLVHGEVSGSWKLQASFFPYWEKVKVKPIFSPGVLKEKTASVEIKVSSNRSWQAEKKIVVEEGSCQEVEIPIPGFPEGTYTVCAQLFDSYGQLLGVKEVTYRRKVFPWEHNNLGLTKRVIKPWIPILVRKQTVSVWGRDYTLDGSGLPASIISQGKEILTRPVHFSLSAEGKKSQSKPSGRLIFLEKSPDTVSWSGKGKVEKFLTFHVTGKAEYDGFCWWEISFSPSRRIKVEQLQLIIPLSEHTAQLMHFQSHWARTNFSGAIPEGQGTVFHSLQTKHYGRPGGFSPHIWIGRPERGLSWFADSDENWFSCPEKPALEIVRNAGEVAIVLNIINKPVWLDAPRTISLGMMATPVKPLLPIKNIFTRAVNWLGADNQTVFGDHMYAPYPKNFDYQLADRMLEQLGRNSEGVRLYFNKHELGAALPELEVFDYEWGGSQPAPSYPGDNKRFSGIYSRAVNRSLTDSRIDMLVYYIAEMVKKTRLAGTYWDITGIGPGLPMLENKTAYLDAEGKVIPTFDILKSRQLFKRVATMWQDIREQPDYMVIHSTNHLGIPFYSFGYSLLNFEWLWPGPKLVRDDGTQKDFIDLRPLDLYAAEGTARQLGLWVSSIDRYTLADTADEKTKRRMERSAAALAGLHNHLNGPQPGIGKRESVTFIGYWDEYGRVFTDQQQVKASLWIAGEKVQLLAANLSTENCTVKIYLNVKGLGVKLPVVVKDVETDEVINSLEKNKDLLPLTLEIAAHDYRLIRLDFSSCCQPGKISIQEKNDPWKYWRKKSLPFT